MAEVLEFTIEEGRASTFFRMSSYVDGGKRVWGQIEKFFNSDGNITLQTDCGPPVKLRLIFLIYHCLEMIDGRTPVEASKENFFRISRCFRFPWRSKNGP
jgi:hypothetical protein